MTKLNEKIHLGAIAFAAEHYNSMDESVILGVELAMNLGAKIALDDINQTLKEAFDAKK